MDSVVSVSPARPVERGGVVFCIWDVASVPIPASVSPLLAAHRVVSLAAHYGRLDSVRCICCSPSLLSADARQQLADGGVELEDVQSAKDAVHSGSASVFVVTRILRLSLSIAMMGGGQQAAPRPVLLVLTADRDLASALSLARRSGLYGEVALVHPAAASPALIMSATIALDWAALLGSQQQQQQTDTEQQQQWQAAAAHTQQSVAQDGGEGRPEGEAAAETDAARQAEQSGAGQQQQSGSAASSTASAEGSREEKEASTAMETSAGDEEGQQRQSGGREEEEELERFASSVANMGLSKLTPSPSTGSSSMPSSAASTASLYSPHREMDGELLLPHHTASAGPQHFGHTGLASPHAAHWEMMGTSSAGFNSTLQQQEGQSRQGAGAFAPSHIFSPAAAYPTASDFSHQQQQLLSDADLAAYAELKEAQRQAQQLQSQQAYAAARFYPSAVQSTFAGRHRKLSSTGTAGAAPLPLAVQPSIPSPVSLGSAARPAAADRLSPRHRSFVSVFHRVLAYCEQEKIIPRESVVKKRLLDSKLSMDVEFEEFLQIVLDSGQAVIEGEPPQRVIWPRHAAAEGGGARRFACADFFQPSQRLSPEQTHELLLFLSQFQPTIDRGRFGFAQWLARHGPKFIQLLPHGVLVELVQLLLNQKILLFRKGKVSVSPMLSSDPQIMINALQAAAQQTADAAGGGGGGGTVSNPSTPPSTPPSQPQWPTTSTPQYSHYPQQQQQYAQQQHQYSASLRAHGGGRASGGLAAHDAALSLGSGGYAAYSGYEDPQLAEYGMDGREKDAAASRDRLNKNKTWSHPYSFSPAFSAGGASSSSSNSTAGSTASLPALNTSGGLGGVGGAMATSPPSTGPNTPSMTPSSSPFPQAIGRPRMGSMPPPQIPRPPSNQSGAAVAGSASAATTDSPMPSRVPSRASQTYFAFSSPPPSGALYGPDGVAALPSSVLSPRAVERSALVGQEPDLSQQQQQQQLSFQSTPTRNSSSGGSSQHHSGGSGMSAVGNSSRRATPQTSPSLGAQAASSFSTRPSSPFEFGLPLSAADNSLFSSPSSTAAVSAEKDSAPRTGPNGIPPVPSGAVDRRLKATSRSLHIASPASTSGAASPMSHTASLSIISSLASTTSPSLPVTPNSTSFFSSHSPMSQAGSQPNSADSNASHHNERGGGGYGEQGDDEGSRPRSASNPIEPYLPVPAGHAGLGAAAASSRRLVTGHHQRHHSSSSNHGGHALWPLQPDLPTSHSHHHHQQLQQAKHDYDHHAAAAQQQQLQQSHQ